LLTYFLLKGAIKPILITLLDINRFGVAQQYLLATFKRDKNTWSPNILVKLLAILKVAIKKLRASRCRLKNIKATKVTEDRILTDLCLTLIKYY
jgi:hypothetical protein